MNTLSLAMRNLLRNDRRSLTTLLAMAIGAITVLIFGGYSGNIKLGLQTGYVRESGHLQIQHKDYFLYGSGNPAAYGIKNYERIIQIVQQDAILKPLLAIVTPTLSLGGIAGNFNEGVSRTVIGKGIVVAEQNKMRLWNEYDFPQKPYQMALTGTPENAAVIGTGVARTLQLCQALKVKNCPSHSNTSQNVNQIAAPDDITALSQQESTNSVASAFPRIELLAANSHGAPNVAALDVVKAELHGVKEYDDILVMLHLPQAQKLIYGGETPQVTAIVIQLKHTADLPAAQARLNQLFEKELKHENLEAHDFATLNASYGQITGMFSAIFGFIAMLIGAIVLFTISNTMSMAVMERTVEIGTLRAMGLRRSGIRQLFICEGVLLGAIGAFAGITLALGIAYLINHGGLTWLPPGNTGPVALTVRVWGETRMMAATAIGLMLVAAMSAWWPARRAAQMNIVDALRHV